MLGLWCQCCAMSMNSLYSMFVSMSIRFLRKLRPVGLALRAAALGATTRDAEGVTTVLPNAALPVQDSLPALPAQSLPSWAQ